MSKLHTPIIHIGMPKTGTKTLQWHLFSRHSEIFYLGRFDGPYFGGTYVEYDACRNRNVQNIMREIAYQNILLPDFVQCKHLLTEVLKPAFEQSKVPVWSWESYATDILAKRRHRAQNLKKLFGDAKILMTIRHPVKLLESAFIQQLKRDNIRSKVRRGSPPYYLPIDRWLEENFFGEILPHLDYAETILLYIETFGIDNIHVMLFEDLLEDRSVFYREICEFIGIDVEEGLQLTGKHIENSRWTEHQLKVLRDINKSPLKSLQFRFSGRKARERLLHLDKKGKPVMSGAKAQENISIEGRKIIIEYTKQGNHWLEKNLGLSLRKYGYFDI